MIEKSDQHQQLSTVGGPKLMQYNTFSLQKRKGASLIKGNSLHSFKLKTVLFKAHGAQSSVFIYGLEQWVKIN